jgi:hypothetical protein
VILLQTEVGFSTQALQPLKVFTGTKLATFTPSLVAIILSAGLVVMVGILDTAVVTSDFLGRQIPQEKIAFLVPLDIDAEEGLRACRSADE